MIQECVLSQVGDSCRWSSGFDWLGFLTALVVIKAVVVGAWLVYRWRRNRRPRVEGSISSVEVTRETVDRMRENIRARMRDA